MSGTDTPALLRAKEACERLGIDRRRLRALIKHGDINVIRPTKKSHPLIPLSEIKRLKGETS